MQIGVLPIGEGDVTPSLTSVSRRQVSRGPVDECSCQIAAQRVARYDRRGAARQIFTRKNLAISAGQRISPWAAALNCRRHSREWPSDARRYHRPAECHDTYSRWRPGMSPCAARHRGTHGVLRGMRRRLHRARHVGSLPRRRLAVIATTIASIRCSAIRRDRRPAFRQRA